MKKLSFFLLAIFLFSSSFAQTPQRELRGTWLATVSNIDWPKSNDMATQKQELITILEKLQTLNMNAVFLQVRPYSDAFYNSAYEPWSSYLTGTRGNDPGYDPLQFAIDEAHKRGIEIHAWMNPYRASSNSVNDCVGAQSSWFLEVLDGDGVTRYYYNPGVPEVTTYITNVVSDLVGKYELDGVVFDDYFYPGEIENEDATTFATYGGGKTIGDFRRTSVNSMIKAVNTTIKAAKPDMRFGVSPAGIYSMDGAAATAHGTTLPAEISGRDAYHIIYCDPLAWLEEGSVDYLSPQIYWEINDVAQNYNVLTEWWGKECKRYGKHCYPSIAAYKYGQDPAKSTSKINGIEAYFLQELETKNNPKTFDFQEYVDEITVNRANEVNNVFGSVFYSTKHITGAIDGLGEYIGENAFQEQSLFQELSWLTSPATTTPTNLAISQGEFVAKLTWTGNSSRYAVFGVNTIVKAEPVLLKMVFTESFSLENMNDYTEFSVAAVNNKGEISTASTSIQLLAPVLPVLVNPLGTAISSSEVFAWNTSVNATSYTLNIYSDEALTTQVYTENSIKNSFAFSETLLQGQETYYWEIVSTNAVGTIKSASASFTTAFPRQASISNILNNATNLAIEGNVEFMAQAEATSYFIQFSRDASFYITQIVLEKEVTTTTAAYTSLLYSTDYYVRAYALNASGKGMWSEVIHFSTLANSLAAPVITEPLEAQFIDDSQVTIAWNKVNAAAGYRLNVSNTSDFSTVIHTQDFDSYTRILDYSIAFGEDYYLRIASKATDGNYGAWSETLFFTNKTPNSIETALANQVKVYPNPVIEYLNIELEDHQQIENVKIYNMNGSLILDKPFLKNKIALNLSELSSGIYQGIIRTTNNKQLSFRFVK